MIFKLLVTFILGTSFCDARRYENYTFFRGLPVEEIHLDFLRNLSSLYDVNYWRMPGSLRMPVDFLIAPNDKEPFLKEASKNGVYLTTIMEDIQSAFDQQTVKSYTRKNMDTFDWKNFYRTKDIYNWMIDLGMAYPNEVHIFSIGKSYEGRDILAARVILKGSELRSKVIIEGGIHAREWISPAFVTFMLHKIVFSKKTKEKLLMTVALSYEWYFIPILNPDGYEYTFTHDRNWRKNRHGTGVDLNRNFGYVFGTVGVSRDKNSEVYCGPNAFSEPESTSMAKFVRQKSEKLEYYLSFHSYGQYIVIPYAHSTLHLDNYYEVREMASKSAYKIKSYYNTLYTIGTAYDTVGYKVSGASACWAKKSFGVPYVLTFELRDRGSYGFALPPKQIVPTCEETLGGLLIFLQANPGNITTMKKKYDPETKFNGSSRMSLNETVVVFIELLFIIVRFG